MNKQRPKWVKQDSESQWLMSALGWKWKWSSLSRVRLFATPMDYTIHEILQARVLEWVADPFSRASSQPRDQTQVSRIASEFFTSWATRALG